MVQVAAHNGLCPSCDGEGPVGAACSERVCRKNGYRFVPRGYLARTSGSTRAPEPLVGRAVADYLVVDVLGVGGFGKVYLALQLPILMKTALKLMDQGKFKGEVADAMVKKFEGEAAALAALSHPNIVRLLKYGVHAGLPYLVMEYVDQGRTLKQEIAERAARGQEFTPDEVLHILRQVVGALEAAHAREIVHRDIKPDNIMLQELAGLPNFVRVLDFGMAKFVVETDDTNYAMGTPSYMAPEQLTRKHIGPWTDFYAVGVMAYELISGRRPFAGRNQQEILARKLDPAYDPLSRIADMDIPERVFSFLRRALARDFAQRHQTADDFRVALERAFQALNDTGNVSLQSVQLEELVDSTDLQKFKAEQARLDEERSRFEQERRRLDEERRRLDEERRQLSARLRDDSSGSQDTNPGMLLDIETARARIEAFEVQGDWRGVIAYKRRLLPLVKSDVERFAVQASIGDIYRERLGDREAAAEAYSQALGYGVFSKAPLLHLVQLHSEARRFAAAVGCLERLVEAETDPRRKAQYAMNAGTMTRDALGDDAGAVTLFGRALDYDPEQLDAFRAIEAILLRKADYQGLALAYQQMVHRLQAVQDTFDKAPGLLFLLFKSLGKLRRERLNDLPGAVEAYEVALRMRPTDDKIRSVLVELYEAAGLDAKAAEQHRLRIKREPNRFDSYHRVIELYQRLGRTDRAWMIAGLSVALGQATADELRFYQSLHAPLVTPATRPLEEGEWLHLVVGPPEAPRLGQILGILYHTLGRHLATRSVKDFGLRRRDRVDLGKKTPLSHAVKTVSRFLGLPTPDVYRVPEASVVRLVPVLPPALIVGEDILHAPDDAALYFRLAKQIAFFHPFHVLSTIYDDDELNLLLLAASCVAEPSATLYLPEDLPLKIRRAVAQRVGSLHKELERNLTPMHRQELLRLAPGLLGGESLPNLGAWRRLMELTANHAGLVAAGDVALVGDVLRQEPETASILGRGDKLKDLVLWVLSQRFVDLRESLGLVAGAH